MSRQRWEGEGFAHEPSCLNPSPDGRFAPVDFSRAAGEVKAL